MELRNRTTGAVITDSQLRAEHPNTSFPEVITPDVIDDLGYDPVFEGPQPDLVAPYEYAQRDGVIEIEGKWYTNYIAVEPDDDAKVLLDEKQATAVRSTRTKLLADCDWTQLSDAPVDATAWADYRQELRDITAQSGFPWNITWPTEP